MASEVSRLVVEGAALPAPEPDDSAESHFAGLVPGLPPPPRVEPLREAGPPAWPSIPGFHLQRVLGGGISSTVYLAKEAHPPRLVALKVLRPWACSSATVARFANEIDALARLRHPHIARIYAAGRLPQSDGGRTYFSMEYVRGTAITVHVATHRPSPDEQLELLAQVATAVQHAHDHGVVHRDLKPANVLVDDSGEPKVLDFGVASLRGARGAPDQQVTADGDLLGTLAYMSPEQISGDAARCDHRTDVYALGLLAYEVLAGRPAVDATRLGLDRVIEAVQWQEPAPLGRIAPRWRGDVDYVVRKALRKDPGDRYATAAELARDLRAILRSEPITARAPSLLYHGSRFVRRRREPLLAALGLFAALATSAWTLALDRGGDDASQLASFLVFVDDRTGQSGWRGDTVAEALLSCIDRMPDYGIVDTNGIGRAKFAIARRLVKHGEFVAALDLLAESIDELTATDPVDPGVLGDLDFQLGTLLLNLGLDLPRAAVHLARAESLAVEVGPDAAERATRARAAHLHVQAKLGASAASIDELRSMLHELRSRSDHRRARFHVERALFRCLSAAGQNRDAQRLALEAIRGAVLSMPPPARLIAGLRFDYGTALVRLVEGPPPLRVVSDPLLAAATEIFGATWVERERHLGGGHPWALNARGWLGYGLALGGQFSEGSEHMLAALRGFEGQGLGECSDATFLRSKLALVSDPGTGE